MKLTWLQVTLMVLHGDIAAKTTSNFYGQYLAYATGPHTTVDMWADVCGFLKPPGSQRCWKVSKHGAFSIPRETLGLRPTDQSCHPETWLHLDFDDWSNTWSKQDVYEQRISLKKYRPADGA